MKKVLFCLIALVAAITNAQNLQKGYHGSVEVGYGIMNSNLDPTVVEVLTSHGFQFNPYVFVGLGLGVDYTGKASWLDSFQKREAKSDIPVFLTGRFNFTQTKFSPFLDIKGGVVANDEWRVYVNGAVGCRYALGNNLGVSLSLGYVYRRASVDERRLLSRGSFYYAARETDINGFIIRAGFDF